MYAVEMNWPGAILSGYSSDHQHIRDTADVAAAVLCGVCGRSFHGEREE